MADETAQQTGEEQWAPWQRRIAAARRRREDRVALWQENVDKRRHTERGPDGTSDRGVSVNQDWPLTKAKIAQLYSQTPEVRLTPRDEQFRPAVPAFGRELNDTIAEVGVGSTIEEVLADVINAAGIGAVLVSCETRTEPREVPTIDPATLPPDIQMALMEGAFQMPMETVEHTVDRQYLGQRISPADLIVPSDFTGSNYDHARWLGHDGRLTWPQAQRELGLSDEQKEDVLGSDKRAGGTTHSLNTDSMKFRDTEVVNYTEVFYWRHFYHAEETSFKALQRLVMVDGLEAPVINQPYSAQQRDEQTGRMVGVVRNPIQVLTLTYISDDSLPPSDSSIGRFIVNELEESRDAMLQQRRHSVPIRWFDSNRVSANTRALLEKGTFQGFIPTNGPGDRAVGEVSRAAFPPEKWEIDKLLKSENSELWQVGTNQAGAFAQGERSASEAKIIQQNFQTRVGQERDKVTKFFLGIVEVLAGHLALYGTFDLPDELGEQRALIANAFTYSVRVDSTVRLDAEQRIEQLTRTYNLLAQSGYLNSKTIIEEIIELNGLDPSKCVMDPKPKPPEPVKVSVSKAEDLMNPMFVAALMATGQAPTPEHVAAAIALLKTVLAGMPPEIMPAGPPDDRQPAEIETPEIETAARVDRRAEDFGA